MKTLTLVLRTLPLLVLAMSPGSLAAHCDTLDGPVATTALTALETGRLEPVLAWVKPAGEAEVRSAFEHTLAVRKLGGQARALSDRYFLETLVRVHRAGEGAPFTGLKPGGQDLGPALPAADRAVADANLTEVRQLLLAEVGAGLTRTFSAFRGTRPPGADVEAGRKWVAAYVEFVHFVEGVHQAARRGSEVEPDQDKAVYDAGQQPAPRQACEHHR